MNRIRYTKLLQGSNISPDLIKSVMQDENNSNIIKNSSNIPEIPQRKPKQHRPLLLKILEEVGLDDIFDEENEQNKVNQDLKLQELDFQQKDGNLFMKENDLSQQGNQGNNGDNSFIELNKSAIQNSKSNPDAQFQQERNISAHQQTNLARSKSY